MKRIRIRAGATWRGVTYYMPADFDLSDNYADYVVLVLKIADFI